MLAITPRFAAQPPAAPSTPPAASSTPPAAPQDVVTTSAPASAPKPVASTGTRALYAVGTTVVAAQAGLLAFGPLGLAGGLLGAKYGWTESKNMSLKHAAIVTGTALVGGVIGHMLIGQMGMSAGSIGGFVVAEALLRKH